MPCRRPPISLALLVAVLAVCTREARAQAPARAPDVDYAPADPPPQPAVGHAPLPSTAFAMPDLPDSWKQATAFDGRLFSTRLGLVPLVDYTMFRQDEASISQVGDQKDQWDLRTFRIMVNGQMKFARRVDYFISIEVKGKDHVQGDDDSKLGFTDWYFGTELGPLGTLRYGKVKEPWVYEVAGDAANLQQMERILSPFFVTRNIGLRLSNTMADERMSWAIGWFNDWWVEDQAVDESGNQFSARLTGLPSWSEDGANYVHLAASLRYDGADEDRLRFRGRPESNIASYYVDTGDIQADHANELGFEAVWGRGPFFLTSEWVRAWVDARNLGDPRFWGTYATLSYVLTGEHRPYDRKVAYARRILPQGRLGAWEIFGRYARLDLDDQQVMGGVLDKGTLGLNWWATRRWRISVNYGVSHLDRFRVEGITHAVQLRFQWVY